MHSTALLVVATIFSTAFISSQKLPSAYAFTHFPTSATYHRRNHLHHPPAMSANEPSPDTAPNLEQVKQQISRAISVGAPAYNAGDIKGCADTYAATAQTILSGILPDQLRINLDKCLKEMNDDAGNMNDDARAWALRRQFDAILEYSPPFLPVSLEDACSASVVLEPFTSQQLPSQPIEVMDNVMGGVSSGSWASSSSTSSVGKFRGTTSLANNGGFASLRWRFQTLQNWSYAKGIYLKVKHSNPDEHTFRLILKDGTCERIRLTNFKAVFANPSSSTESASDSSSAILIPFTELGDMEQMGNAMVGAPPFNSSAVTEIGIMAIKPTVIGEFEIKILDWGLYSEGDE